MSEKTGTEMTEKAHNMNTPFLRCSVLSAFSVPSVPVTSGIPVSTISGSSL
jgi:hypothetical protein